MRFFIALDGRETERNISSLQSNSVTHLITAPTCTHKLTAVLRNYEIFSAEWKFVFVLLQRFICEALRPCRNLFNLADLHPCAMKHFGLAATSTSGLSCSLHDLSHVDLTTQKSCGDYILEVSNTCFSVIDVIWANKILPLGNSNILHRSFHRWVVDFFQSLIALFSPLHCVKNQVSNTGILVPMLISPATYRFCVCVCVSVCVCVCVCM